MEAISIFWFRRDLRLHDNHGLFRALSSEYPVLPIFIFDQNILDSLKSKEDRRVTFIYNALIGIQEELQQAGSSLMFLHDRPLQAFQKLLAEFDIKEVYTNHDYEPYAIERDDQVQQLLAFHHIPFHSFKDQVIFEKNEIVKKDKTPYTVYTPYSNAWKAKWSVTEKILFKSSEHKERFVKGVSFPTPTLEEIGFQKAEFTFPSPEVESEIIRHYEKTRNIPAIDGTSRISVHLRFGTVSIREICAKAAQWNEQWLNELIWREFFMQILYHFPRVVTECFKIKYEGVEWRNNTREFELWCKGETGYPMVDAGMRELNETGFMHNRVRMVVASFLTKHLLIDWRWGEAYFAEKLLDYELSSNNGNWQWAAGCGCDAAPYFRIFNPTEQARKFDPDNKYIRRWIPEYAPGYLDPVVDHDLARNRALEVYRRAVNDR